MTNDQPTATTELKPYRIRCNVESVEGWQTWLVRAADEASALAAYKRGEGEYEEEELNVQSLGSPSVELADNIGASSPPVPPAAAEGGEAEDLLDRIQTKLGVAKREDLFEAVRQLKCLAAMGAKT